MAGSLQFFFIVATVGAFLAASEAETLDDAMTGLAWGIGVSSVFSLLYMAGFQVVDQSTVKPAGLFYNSEVLAEFAAPVFLWAVLTKRWSLIVATAIPMVACGSRVAMLAVASGALYAFWPRSKILAAVLVLMLVCGSAIAFVAMGLGKTDSAGLRVVIWIATLLAATPLGNGLGWFETAHPVEQFAHSDAIQAMNELGIGSIFLAVVPVLILRSNRGTNAERAVFVATCVEVAVSFPLHVPGSAFVAALVAGYLAGSGAPVSVGRSDSRDRDAENHKWRDEIGRSVIGGRGLGGSPVPPGPSFEAYAALGKA
jgi:hypothetical protein